MYGMQQLPQQYGGLLSAQRVQTQPFMLQMPRQAPQAPMMARPAMPQAPQQNPMQQGLGLLNSANNARQTGEGLNTLYNTVNGWINPQMGAMEAARNSPATQLAYNGPGWGTAPGTASMPTSGGSAGNLVAHGPGWGGGAAAPAAPSQGGATGLLSQGAQTANAVAPTATGLAPTTTGLLASSAVPMDAVYSAGLLGSSGLQGMAGAGALGTAADVGAGLAGAGAAGAAGAGAAAAGATSMDAAYLAALLALL